MASKSKIAERMIEMGMAWATSSDKHVSPNDPMGVQVRGEKTYHVHPDASHPWQNAIKRYRTLRDLEEYLDWREKVAQAFKDGDEDYAEALLDIEPGTF